MSRLPEPGEVQAAADTLNDRLQASRLADDEVAFVQVNTKTGAMTGAADVLRGTYGDLFDIGEMGEVAVAPVRAFIRDVAEGMDPEVALLSMYLLAVAHGVLMERARWER